MGSPSNDSISNGLCKQRFYIKWAPQATNPYQMGSASNDSISNGFPKQRFYIKWALMGSASNDSISNGLQAKILFRMGNAPWPASPLVS